ncbi:phage capsid protein [Actinomycetospora sp. NBRC 106375]|uniref:phage major capsid protein n=1 Tax=Actinomycetospora sp. NBRC 106375 TaxID=3032207 RepID=UPI0024A149E5|nr:phage major capsid protein [Actinomycetospora sp. NBRC 106375]GLZ47969.1 phage capsid protein [Actinomycetospora sp. NBRC 106375]
MTVNIIDRTDALADVPQQVAQAIVGEVETTSTVMRLGKRVPVSTKEANVPVLTSVPDAAWLTGDTGWKPTTQATWENVTLLAEEIACVVPVPDAVLDDASFDVWEMIKPLVSRAFARKIDAAVMFGHGGPASFGPGMVARATTATHVVAPTSDYAADLLSAAEAVSLTEHSVTGAVVRPGWQWTAARQRTGELVANPVGGDAFPLRLLGMGVATDPVYFDATQATAIVADWTSVLYGVRQDMTFQVFDSGVIQDEDGSIAYNLIQQDVSALRCVMRIGHVLATPVNAAGVAGVPVAIVDNA